MAVMPSAPSLNMLTPHSAPYWMPAIFFRRNEADHTDMNLHSINQLLHMQLPGASLSLQELPACKPLVLYLLQGGFDDSQLDQATIERISDDPPYWIFCWASGHALAGKILRGEIDVRKKTVVDFGAGSGVVAIAAALAGAEVMTCEIDPVGNHLIALNAAANNVQIRQFSNLSDIPQPVDLILAADVLYEKRNLQFLDLFLRHAPDVIVADSRQKNLSHPAYRQIAACRTTSFPDFGEAKEFNDVRLYRAGGER